METIFIIVIVFLILIILVLGLALAFSIVFYKKYKRLPFTEAKQLPEDETKKVINDIKKEQLILTSGVLACLKGLKEQGCDGPVTEAIKSIEGYINQQAHK